MKKRTNNMNYLNYLKEGSKIHIKKKNRGKFTDYCGGKVTSECIARGKHSASAAVRKRATFAANARKWKHEEGGILKAAFGDSIVYSTAKARQRFQNLFKQNDDFEEIKNPFEQEKQEPQSSSKQETLTWDNLNNEYDASVSQPSVVTQQVNPIVASNSEFTADKSKPKGYRNNNPLNIRISKNAWEGKVQNNTDGEFEQFDEMKNGWRAAFINMDSHISRGDNTLRKMIGKWAPTLDNNNPEKYASDVANAAGISVDDIINIDNPDLMKRIAKAMAFVENKQKVEDLKALNSGWDLGYAAILKRRETQV